MHFIFLRHPETIANIELTIYGKTDSPYSEKGKRQFEAAVASVEQFNIKQIISSPIGRAHNLAKAVAHKLDIEVEVDARLEEMNFGILEGLSENEAKKRYPELFEKFMTDYKSMSIPEGETHKEFCSRVGKFIETWRNTDARILVVSHSGTIRRAIEYLIGGRDGFGWQVDIGNCSFLEVEVKETYAVIKNLINLKGDL